MHLCINVPMNSCRPIMEKTARKNSVSSITSVRFFSDFNNEFTIILKPEGVWVRGNFAGKIGRSEMVLFSFRNVLSKMFES